MDPFSGTPSSPDPVVTTASEGGSTYPENAELFSGDPIRLTSGSGMPSLDPSSSCTRGTPSKSVQELAVSKQVTDAPSTSSSFSKTSLERAHKPSPNKKTHHTPGAENRSFLQKSFQPSRPSTQTRSVQWVRVSPQSQKFNGSCTHDTGDSGKQVSIGSSLTSGPQTEVSSSSDMSRQATSSSLVSSEKQTAEDVKAIVDKLKTGSSMKVPEIVEPVPWASATKTHDQSVNPLIFNENVVQEVTEDERPPSLATQDIEARLAGLVGEATNDNDSSGGDLYEAVEEQIVSSSMNFGAIEDEQACESQEQKLSRTSSLSAEAREFVPTIGTPPSAAPTVPAQPPQPPQMHVLPLPLVIPLNAAPGILPLFPPTSPLPSPQLGGYTLHMASPPPPPIPVPIMSPVPLLGPPHARILKVGPPPPPIVSSPSYLIHSSFSSLPVPLQIVPAPLVDSLVEPLGIQCAKHSEEALQDQHQSREPDLAVAQPGLMKSMLTEDLRSKIVKQVEFYFSDGNLPTDHYLMKFVKKDPEGFVPIPLVASFQKVKNLTKNHLVVAAALCTSKQLVVSSDCKKVRRLNPIPFIDLEEIQSRTVVAEKLPLDYSIESIQQLFGSVGNVKMVRICEPEAMNGANQAKLSKADMVVSNQLHALVEYETVAQAERAVAELTDAGNWRRGLCVRLLLRRPTKPPPKALKVNGGANGSATEDDATPCSRDNVVERTREEEQIQERSDELLIGAASKKGRGRGPGRGRGRGHHPNGSRSHPVGTPPQANSFSNSELKPPLGPRMPDGTRGFTLGRGKKIPSNSV